MKLPKEFYLNQDVVAVAKMLLGKCLYTSINNEVTAGIITETEAYAGITDKASHAYGGRRTNRTKVMYEQGGVSYVYLCYGIHSLFNVVTNNKDIPHAVLVRSIKPFEGIDTMLKRANKKAVDKTFGIGPGKVTKILGIDCTHTALSLLDSVVWIEDRGIKVLDSDVQITKRIGIDYAQEDALLPYRFIANNVKCV